MGHKNLLVTRTYRRQKPECSRSSREASAARLRSRADIWTATDEEKNHTSGSTSLGVPLRDGTPSVDFAPARWHLAESLLPRLSGLLCFNLQLVHHLLHVRNHRRDPLRPRAFRLRVDLTSQRDNAIRDSVFYALVKLLANESSIQIALDTLVQVRVHRFCSALDARRNHCNLVSHNLVSREGPCDGFGVRLVIVRGNVSVQGDHALVTIPSDRDIFEAGLIQRCANARRNVGRISGCR